MSLKILFLEILKRVLKPRKSALEESESTTSNTRKVINQGDFSKRICYRCKGAGVIPAPSYYYANAFHYQYRYSNELPPYVETSECPVCKGIGYINSNSFEIMK